MSYEPPPPGYQAYPVARPDHPRAVLILVLGILSLVACHILGPVVWAMGSRARREIRESQGALGGDGMVTAGWVCGIIASAVVILFVLIFGSIIVFSIFADSTN